MVMIPHEGNSRSDLAIQKAQAKVKAGIVPVAAMEKLGWAYVAKARESFDTGYYLLARKCADALELEKPESPEALLLRGHVFTNLHKFSEAEKIAEKLVEMRGIPFDHLLLGDAQMEQGKLDAAIESYQRGVDLRPDLQSYARAGWIRWLTGDLPGAIEATQMAVNAGSPQDPDSLSWALTRLANFHFLGSQMKETEDTTEAALRVRPDYPPALLLKAKLLMADKNFKEAIPLLQTANRANPMPDYQWTLIEALEAAGNKDELATAVEAFRNSAERVDPRTYSLYLATHGQDTSHALALAKAEFEERQDIFTHDALAWALFSEGKTAEAKSHMDEALIEVTEDGRLFLHGAIIAESAGETEEALDWLEGANDLRHTLLPSEQQHLKFLDDKLAGKTLSSTPIEGDSNPIKKK